MESIVRGLPDEKKSTDSNKLLKFVTIFIVILAIVGTGVYFLTRPQPESAEFQVSNLEVNPEEAEIGEEVNISVNVRNVGGLKKSKTLSLKVNKSARILRDVSGQGNDGIIHRADRVTLQEVDYTQENDLALRFQQTPGTILEKDVENNYVEIPNDSSLNFGDGDFGYFVRFKVKKLPLQGASHLLEKQAPYSGHYQLQFYGENLVAWFGTQEATGHSKNPIGVKEVVKENHMFDALVVRKEGIGYIYVNGEKRVSGNADFNVNNSGSLILGMSGGKWKHYYNGLITDVRIYNRALNSTEAEKLHEGQSISSGGLVGHWPVCSIENRFETESTKEVTLEAGESKTVTFSTSAEKTGNYLTRIGALEGSFEAVESSTTPTPTPTPTPSGVQIRVSGTSGISFQGGYGDVGGQQSVEGTIPETYYLGEPQGGIVSASFQKWCDSGTLTVEIIDDGQVVESRTTTASYGVVTVSYSE